MERKINNGIFYVAISLVAVLGIGSAIFAFSGGSPKVIVEGDYIEAQEQLTPQEIIIGAIPGGDIYQPVTFYDTVGFGDGRNRFDTFTKVISFADATTTAVFWKAKDDGFNDFYLKDLWIENTGKATSTVRICVSTTTDTAIARDATAYLDADAGTCTLMRTLGNAFGPDGATYLGETATSSQFHMFHYPGTDTRIAAFKSDIVIASTTKIFVFATSSEASMATTGSYPITGSGNTFDGKLYIVGRESTR